MNDDDAQPNPARREFTISYERVGKLRVLSCARYDACLSHALREYWESWDCSICEVDDLVPLEPISVSAGTSRMASLAEGRASRGSDSE